MNQVEEITEVDKSPRRLWASDVEKTMRPEKKIELPEFERGSLEKAYVGALNTVVGLGDTPEQIEIYGDRIDLGFSGYFGADDVEIDRKKSNLITAERNLLEAQRERSAYSSVAEAESLSFMLGSGAVSYGSMLLPAGVINYAGKAMSIAATSLKTAQTVAGITTMAGMEFGGQVSQRTPLTDTGEVDVNAITPEWARKSTASTAMYLATSAVLEKYIGLGEQVNSWSKPIKLSSKSASAVASASKRIATMAAKTGASEALTETSQALADTGFLLADGTISMEQVPERIKGMWKEAVVGGLLGSAAGTAVGINQKANVLKSLHEIVDPVVGDPKASEVIVNEIYAAGTADLTTVMSKEIELSSELESKHGLVMDNMGKAIYEAIDAAGAFAEVSEVEKAEYVADTSKLFADQVLAEANKRGVLIDGILSGSDIKYENGKIQLASGENVIAQDTILDGEQLELLQTEDTKTDTPEFKTWFGDSKVVDDSGEPLVVYHGTNVDIKEFDPEKISSGGDYGLRGKGFYFSPNKRTAQNYGKNINPVYVSLKNPFDPFKFKTKEDIAKHLNIDESTFIFEPNIEFKTTSSSSGNITAQLKEKGYDGVIYPARQEVVAFYPEQIKSTTNKGKFDPADPNIFNQTKKGSFNVSEQAIELTKDADFSTLPHELSHYWLTNMYDFVGTGKASDAYMKNFDAVSKYLGIQDGQKFLTRNQQEKFAKGYEKYLTKGTLPNRMVGDAFDNYDKWMKKVYARVPKNKLTPEMVEFFKTMTTGELVEPKGYEPTPELVAETKELVTKETKEVIKERQTEILSNPVDTTSTTYGESTVSEQDLNKEPVIDTEDSAESAVFKKHAKQMGLEGSLEYNVANIAAQNKLAEEFLQANPQEAKDVVYGKAEAPKTILKNAIYNAYLKQMLAIGNTQEYINALQMQSLELTRAGQEIASQRGVVKDIFDPAGWVMQIMEGRKHNINKDYDSKVDTIVDDNIDSILAKDTVEAQQAEIDRVIKSAGKELGQKPEELFQTLNEKLTGKKSVYTAMRNQIDDSMGVTLNEQDSAAMIGQVENLRKNISNTVDKNGNPSVEFFRMLNDTENLANKLNPTNRVAVMTSIVGRGAMLASIKSPFLNIESNFLNSILERITRRAMLQATSDVKIDNQVDENLKREYMEYSKKVYSASGYTISSMLEFDPKVQFKGEQFQHSQGKGAIRAIGRMVEQTVFKYSLGYNDRYMKDLAFTDSVGLEASKQARIEKASDVKARANEIFQDAIKIEPNTPEGMKIREIAVNESLMATYMNDTKLAEYALKLREIINSASGDLRIGDLLSPFVKTPANVVSLGLEYSLGGARVVKNMDTILNDFRTGKVSETTRTSIRSLSRNALGMLASVLIAGGLIDEEDYIPDYSLLSPKQRTLVKQKNGVFNSIRIGGKYVNLDYFGALAMPLVGALEFRRAENIMEGIFGYGKGTASQLLKLPVVGDLKDIYADISRKLTQSGDKTFEGLGEWGMDLISARTIPAFVSDIAKQIDGYERETNRSAINRAISKIPFARETLPKRYNFVTGDPVKAEAYNFLFGARVKSGVFNYEMSQIEEIVEAGFNVTLTDPTRYGSLKDLTDVEKTEVRGEFAESYSDTISEEMSKGSWDKKDNEDKAKKLNKIRSKIVKGIKKTIN